MSNGSFHEDDDLLADPHAQATVALLRRTLNLAAESVTSELASNSQICPPHSRPLHRRSQHVWATRAAAGVVAIGGLAAVAAVGLTDSPSDRGATTDATVQTTPAGPDDAQPVYVEGVPWDPSQLVNPPTETRRAIASAVETVTAACMERQGFEYLPRPDDTVDEAFDPRPDDDDLRQHGYPTPVAVDNDAAWDAFQAQSQDPEWERALIGGPTSNVGGCNREALLALYGAELTAVPPRNAEFIIVLDEFVAEVDSDKATDPVISSVFTDWRACMAVRGYDVLNPGVLVNQYVNVDRLNGAGPTDAEITTALDDYACRDSANYTDRYWGRLQELTAQFAQENQDLINSMTSWWSQVEQRAQAILAGVEPTATAP